jgi:hypothetical protein
MSTSATITFEDEYGTKFHVFRSHDAFPEVVLPDMEKTIAKTEGRFCGSEIGLMVSTFLGITYQPHLRIQHYEMYSDFMDGSYRYHFKYIKGKWMASAY